jgi:hypothetical protein
VRNHFEDLAVGRKVSQWILLKYTEWDSVHCSELALVTEKQSGCRGHGYGPCCSIKYGKILNYIRNRERIKFLLHPLPSNHHPSAVVGGRGAIHKWWGSRRLICCWRGTRNTWMVDKMTDMMLCRTRKITFMLLIFPRRNDGSVWFVS